MKSNKPTAIVFFQYLPPWRIDVFNEMATYYNLTIVYTNSEREGFKYNREDLLNRLDKDIKNIFLNNGFKIGNRPVRFGILKLIKKIKPDIIFSHEYSPTSIMLGLFNKLKLANYKYIITTSDNLSIAESVKGGKAIFRKFVLTNSDAAVVYSEVVKQFYENKFPNLRVEICPNIQNPTSLLKNRVHFSSIIEDYKTEFNLKDYNVVLYTGRLIEGIKGLDLLLKAFAKSNYSNYKLVLVGDGVDKELLEQKCEELKIRNHVIFAGFFSGKELYAWYDIANFYVLPSRYEPFGAVVNEALVFGCPVLASKYIGAVDFISDFNGELIDPMDENKFVDVLNDFYAKYEMKSIDRDNLMPVSFKHYVEVFHSVFYT